MGTQEVLQALRTVLDFPDPAQCLVDMEGWTQGAYPKPEAVDPNALTVGGSSEAQLPKQQPDEDPSPDQ
jgi:hypothetical protein